MGKSKIGRNDMCPCGSGKKYKKCCLLKEGTKESSPDIIMGDAASLRMNYLLDNMNRGEFMRGYKGPARDIAKSVFGSLPTSPSKEQSEKVLLLWKDKLEEEIKQLCSRHSKYYWLFLSRRIFPETIEPYDRSTTPYLHHATFNMAILKYGNSSQTEEFVAVPSSFDMRQYISTEEPYSGDTLEIDKMNTIEMEDLAEFKEASMPTIIPRQITREDALNIYQIEYLSLDYYNVTAQLRRLWKGGKLGVGQWGIGVVLPEEVEYLTKLYDERQADYGNLLSSFGSLVGLDTIERQEALDKFILFVPVTNIEKHKVPLVFPGEEFFDGKLKGPVYFDGNPSNFVPVPVSVRPFYEKMCIFRQPIADILGFSPEEFVAFLIAVDRHHRGYWIPNIRSRYNFFQRGYTLIPYSEAFHRYFEGAYIEAHNHLFGEITREQASSSFKAMRNWMTYGKADFENISLWDRRGTKLFLKVPGGLLTDHSAIPAVLVSVFSELSARASVDGKVGQLRGDDFENEVESYLRLSFSDFKPWICHRKLQFLSGLERDVDVSFIVGEVLFIVECKAFSVAPAFGRGEEQALQTRQEKVDAALKQADTLCELLSKERGGRNFELGQGVTHIIAIVASPFPEYVPKSSGKYFLTPKIPRVCTPQEIAEFVRQFRLSTYLSKPFVWRILD